MSDYVLDASAVIAFLNSEPGGDRVAEIIENAVISAVNFSEVITKLIETGIPETEICLIQDYLSCEIIPFGETEAIVAAKLRPLTRHLGLSLGDRACLSLALQLKRTPNSGYCLGFSKHWCCGGNYSLNVSYNRSISST